MNRVTGIFESELAISFQVVAGSDQLIFTDPQSDPFDGNNASLMLNQNQQVVSSVIGVDGFDLGHVFSQGGGGLAAVGVVCFDGLKAQGVSALSNPIGDPFDVDFVAHEIGHQFGASHTYNGCFNEGGFSSSYEPGSGSTIMAYAGICGEDNLQNNSDPYFHSVSFEQIQSFVTQGAGSLCPEVVALANTPPAVRIDLTNLVIPSDTPFILEGNAQDAEGDQLTWDRPHR
jgi:hypothetical protein